MTDLPKGRQQKRLDEILPAGDCRRAFLDAVHQLRLKQRRGEDLGSVAQAFKQALLPWEQEILANGAVLDYLAYYLEHAFTTGQLGAEGKG